MQRLKKLLKKWLKKRQVWSNEDTEAFEYFLKVNQWYSVPKIVEVFVRHGIGDIGKMKLEQAQTYFIKGVIANKNYVIGQDNDKNWFIRRKGPKNGRK